MRRAFIVVGPESTGTKLLTRVLMKLGCFGDDGDVQRLDRGFPHDGIESVVVRRSLPMQRQWPSVGKMVTDAYLAGFTKITVLVCSRDWFCMCRSQVRRGHVADGQQADLQAQRAYVEIFNSLGHFPHAEFLMVSYEAMVVRPNLYCEQLAYHLGFDPPHGGIDLNVHDGNQKHYGGPNEKGKQPKTEQCS